MNSGPDNAKLTACEKKPAPDQLARAVHVSLLTGSVVAAMFFIAGLSIDLTRGRPHTDAAPKLDAALFRAALHGQATALLDLGILSLMLTPLVRIIVLSAGCALRRDYRFALIALLVLALLSASLFIGIGRQ